MGYSVKKFVRKMLKRYSVNVRLLPATLAEIFI